MLTLKKEEYGMQKQSPLLRIWSWGKEGAWQADAGNRKRVPRRRAGDAAIFLRSSDYHKAAGGRKGNKGVSAHGFFDRDGRICRPLRCLYNLALSMSHKATFSVSKTIRQKILEKLPRLPLGTVMDMQSGKMKQIIVDQVDGMETTLAHLFPEMTANIAGPALILIYLFVLDWRMALLSLVTIPIGFAFMMSVMGSYQKKYEGAVRTTMEMNGTIVEYIGGY